jgi:FkbM family methyltransferase
MTYIAENEPMVYDKIVDVLSSACSRPRATFVDSGANEGMWSLLAAKHGCKAIAVEPQLLCLAYVAAAAAKNNLHINMYHNVLAPDPGFALDVRTDECFGTTQFGPDGTSDAFGNRDHAPIHGSASIEVVSRTLDDIVASDDTVVLWQIDTKGAEIDVLRSARRLLDKNRIERIVMEWNPNMWSKYDISVEEGVTLAQELFRDWKCQRLPHGTPSQNTIPSPVVWEDDIGNVYCVNDEYS